MGVRESSIPMSYTTGDSRFDGYHVEICRMILGDIKDKLGNKYLAHQLSTSNLTESRPTGSKWYCGH
jgi:hypothetical protein